MRSISITLIAIALLGLASCQQQSKKTPSFYKDTVNFDLLADMKNILDENADEAKSLAVGDITRPLRSASGFHLIKLVDKRDKTTKMVDQYKVQHLMVASDEIVSAKDGMAIINGFYQQLQDGADFATLAEEHSDDFNSAPLGGDMGWRAPGELGPRMGQIVENLELNEMSSPFQTDAGWHIVKLLDKKQADVTNEYKRQQAKQAIQQRKIQQIIESWVREIRGEAFVDIRL